MILSSSLLEKFAGYDLQINVPHINKTSSNHVSGRVIMCTDSDPYINRQRSKKTLKNVEKP
jgi:hypothetical protein